ncbi:MAG TPA: DUF1489 family protein [Allosphingosinicella sp.]|nr:DUF1489 family protein [Allosphingosinicella sp.]
MPLNISKVAFGCASIETFARRQAQRETDGIVPLVTRFRPTRADELIGGSVFWIVKHRILARQAILGIAVRESDRRAIISLDSKLVPVRATARRAHQGWRYLDTADAPADLEGDETGLAELPSALTAKLAALALI